MRVFIVAHVIPKSDEGWTSIIIILYKKKKHTKRYSLRVHADNEITGTPRVYRVLVRKIREEKKENFRRLLYFFNEARRDL